MPPAGSRYGARTRCRRTRSCSAGSSARCACCPSRSLAGTPTSSMSPLLRLRNDANVGLDLFPAVREELRRFVVADRATDDDVLARLPVDGRGDLELGRQLQ